MNSAARHQL